MSAPADASPTNVGRAAAPQAVRSAVDWCDAEEPVHVGFIAELQRIRRRTIARPLPVLALAIALTGAVAYRLTTHKAAVDAEVVLALSEGDLRRSGGIPVDELRGYVRETLLPDKKLAELIEKRDLFRLRHTMGMHFAIDELREQIDVDVWKNTFMTDWSSASHSARIGITVTDMDPDRAIALARDLAAIAIATANEQRDAAASLLAARIGKLRQLNEDRLTVIEHALNELGLERDRARMAELSARAVALDLELAQLTAEQKERATALAQIARSGEESAAQSARAGLDVTLDIVDEERPLPPDHRGFVLVMALVVVGFCAALGSALVVGAFDGRVHDEDDVERLGLTVLGHLPEFPGDGVGSLEARGAARRRVPSFTRWRWLR